MPLLPSLPRSLNPARLHADYTAVSVCMCAGGTREATTAVEVRPVVNTSAVALVGASGSTRGGVANFSSALKMQVRGCWA
jgi:hypothetical protein